MHTLVVPVEDEHRRRCSAQTQLRELIRGLRLTYTEIHIVKGSPLPPRYFFAIVQ